MNYAVLGAPLDSPQLADFFAALDHINALAEQSPGFIWRLKDDAGNATALSPLGANTLINMSVWQDLASLRSYVYQSGHLQYLRRRREWFEPTQGQLVLWWVKPGHIPTVQEALQKLAALRTHGASPAAFTFAAQFTPAAAGLR